MKFKYISILILFMTLMSCVSTKLTIKNIDNNAVEPGLLNEYTYKLVKTTTDKNFGFNKDYPVNVGFGLLNKREMNVKKYLNALAGPQGQEIIYEYLGSCCPFPTKTTELGGALLDEYSVTWEGNDKPLVLYLNYYEKGELYIPVGLTAKK